MCILTDTCCVFVCISGSGETEYKRSISHNPTATLCKLNMVEKAEKAAERATVLEPKWAKVGSLGVPELPLTSN